MMMKNDDDDDDIDIDIDIDIDNMRTHIIYIYTYWYILYIRMQSIIPVFWYVGAFQIWDQEVKRKVAMTARCTGVWSHRDWDWFEIGTCFFKDIILQSVLNCWFCNEIV